MGDANITNTKNSNWSILYFIGAWILYLAIYETLRSFVDHNTWAGWFGFIVSDVIFSLIPSAYALSLWHRTTDKTKNFFGLISIAFISNFLVACIYTSIFSILHISHDNVHELLLASYNIPYIIVLLSFFLAFGNVFSKAKIYTKKRGNFFSYVPVIVIITVIITLFFSSHSANPHSSTLGKFYDISDLVLQLAGAIIAVLSLIISKNKGLFALALGYTVFIVSELIMNVDAFGQSYWTGSFLETMYFLSCVLSIYGLVYFKKSSTFQQNPIEWTYSKDSIET